MQSCFVCLYVSYYKCYFIVLFKNNFIYLFMQFIWGCAGSWLLWEFLSGCGAQASFCGGFIAEHRLQTSVVVAPRLWSTGSIAVAHELSCSAGGMWGLPRSWIKPVSPAMAEGFFTTTHQGSPIASLLLHDSAYRSTSQLFKSYIIFHRTNTTLVQQISECGLGTLQGILSGGL